MEDTRYEAFVECGNCAAREIVRIVKTYPVRSALCPRCGCRELTRVPHDRWDMIDLKRPIDVRHSL